MDEKFIENFPSIGGQEVLTDDVMESIEGGDCESCTIACQKSNLNATVEPDYPEDPDDPEDPDGPYYL
ncbi:MAG: hypothetical protein LBT25_10215 [Candidatus Symbiothrix sp.]|jgi:hypothetical protein|nr:hypothetical protein [Candidatus Symbiothrix sp.]